MSDTPSYAPRGAVMAAPRVSFGGLPARAAALAGATMGTTWSARLALPAGRDEAAARQAIQAALDEVVAQMSTWEPESDISRYNRAGPGWRELPAAFFHVLRHALALAEDSDGAYDPTVGPLVNAWGFGPWQRGFEPPSPAAIDAARARCGWRRVALDPARQAAHQPGGIYLDLSSIAKGYGVDRAAQALDALGLTDYLVEVGGELRARGQRPDGQPWRVAVEVPDGSDAHALALPLRDLAIATRMASSPWGASSSRRARAARVWRRRARCHAQPHSSSQASTTHAAAIQRDVMIQRATARAWKAALASTR